MVSSKILYTGSCAPEQIITNDDLSKIIDTDHEWILSRSGIGQRRISSGENTSHMAVETAKQILAKGNLDPLSIDLIIVASISPDYTIPSTACMVQGEIGAANAIAFDITAACSGFVFGLSVADKFIKNGTCQNAIVIGAETLSKYTNWADRSTCVLFGDGAGGAYLERGENGGILCEELGSDGTRGESLLCAYSSPANPFNQTPKAENNYIYMDGRAIFDFATRQVPKSIKALLEKAGKSVEDISYVIPHQANSRIVEIVARKTKIPLEKFYMNMYDYGNTSSASIPIAFNEMMEKGLLHKKDLVILTGFGGGLTWGSMLIEI